MQQKIFRLFYAEKDFIICIRVIHRISVRTRLGVYSQEEFHCRSGPADHGESEPCAREAGERTAWYLYVKALTSCDIWRWGLWRKLG